ncbi:MAG: FAD:protein FMN transferase [Saprospiraceae bacterium]
MNKSLLNILFTSSIWCLGLCSLLFESCDSPQDAFIQLEGKAQGTTFSIRYLDSKSRDFSKEVDSLFRAVDHSMSTWDTASIITAFNANLPAQADVHFIRVFERAHAISEDTKGIFDISVGPLVRAWGFSFKKNLPPPDSAMVDSLQQLIGYEKIQLVEGKLVKSNPAMQVDMNAIAQGYTVDVMAEFLESKGVERYMVEIGGEVRTAGLNASETPWQIGIDKPVEPDAPRTLQTVVGLSDRSLATSGSYRKFIERDGHKYSHAINPISGYPVEHSLLSVSVLADNCMDADAYATAFLVMGLDQTMKLAAQKGMDVYCIYADSSNQLQVATTEGFQRLLQEVE